MSPTRAFTPVQLGSLNLEHRIALAPLSRFRNVPDKQKPTDLAAEYYGQRASKGAFLLTETTFISREAGGYRDAPAIHSQEQIDAWRKVTTAVHDKGAFIFSQLNAAGRANYPDCGAPLLPDVKTVGPSPIGLSSTSRPIELSLDDIKRYISQYNQAALNAQAAGFDGVEIQAANGYLIDQFMSSHSNIRRDAYGGSLENRTRFLLEAVGAAVHALGEKRVGVRLSQGMGETNPYELFEFVVRRLVETFPTLAYIHLVEPRARGWTPEAPTTAALAAGIKASNDRFRAIIRGVDPDVVGDDETFVFDEPSIQRPTLVLAAGGFNSDNVEAHVKRTGDVVSFGRYFIANPDLPARIKHSVKLNHYERETFYSGGDEGPANGYTDYPFADELQGKI
ncbi:hypothetical protein JCM11251_006157 [Rhodosporidiobolus azoricus]